ncbi:MULTISPECIES: hypothetical protein [Vibrio oreintalis group]|uniref:Uncharacterized protein n=1 Tax=Vibrio europaeus TaxID=300876 RepID=A0A178J5B5_9VIBR|nr:MULTISPECIES: hypothetical protein [Vibrio oreintalis group]MCG9578809.1 hypothetical protein [Vibrio tubiashii]MDC5708441.1 hypothetical protein [Vibrio europaeus]MDC5713103.1 hypothetical protein [Vibrio europaeus]MDC5728126.1 hypothetical protein [Vibrio europaeus]MDC5733280.1 hypothetical protein [Vibrio europaeus]
MIYVEIALFLIPLVIFGLIVRSRLSSAVIRRLYSLGVSFTMVVIGYSWSVNIGLLTMPSEDYTTSLLIGNDLMILADTIIVVFLYWYIHTILPPVDDTKPKSVK